MNGTALHRSGGRQGRRARVRCLVGFFGITRGLSWTLPSIEANIYEPLRRAGIDVTRMAHFNHPQVLHAPRSGEGALPFAIDDLSGLRLDHHIVEPQRSTNLVAHEPVIMRIPQADEDDADGSTRRNALHQLYSLQRLWQIIEANGPASAFDMLVLLRPDLRYLDPLPVVKLCALLDLGRRSSVARAARTTRRLFRPGVDLIVPWWHSWGGLNDRFAICTPEGAFTYTNRLDDLSTFCAAHAAFRTEELLLFSARRAGLEVGTTSMRADRMRSNGQIEARDRDRVHGRRERLLRPIREALQI